MFGLSIYGNADGLRSCQTAGLWIKTEWRKERRVNLADEFDDQATARFSLRPIAKTYRTDSENQLAKSAPGRENRHIESATERTAP